MLLVLVLLLLLLCEEEPSRAAQFFLGRQNPCRRCLLQRTAVSQTQIGGQTTTAPVETTITGATAGPNGPDPGGARSPPRTTPRGLVGAGPILFHQSAPHRIFQQILNPRISRRSRIAATLTRIVPRITRTVARITRVVARIVSGIGTGIARIRTGTRIITRTGIETEIEGSSTGWRVHEGGVCSLAGARRRNN